MIKFLNPMHSGTINVLQKLFSRFDVLNTIMSDNNEQLTEKRVQRFLQSFSNCTAPYHPQSNGQAKRFVDTFKRALKTSDGNESVDEILQFLLVYRVTLNPSTNLELSSAELMFTRKIKSVFDKMLLKEDKKRRKNTITKSFTPSEKNIGKEIWNAGVR